ncbi:MAG: formylglycine-generating enzyme family protein [bacterium]|jgi:formylglycine-generating enzyme required for sulfatase activity|nr:formylglycine-generating enzyme family protein [bacterium]
MKHSYTVLALALFIGFTTGVTAGKQIDDQCPELDSFCIFSQLSGMATRAVKEESTGETTEFAFERLFVEKLDTEVLLELVWIPPGEFIMGSETNHEDEKPSHTVRISRGFYMGKYEVTQAQWLAVMGINPSGYQTTSRPVERISWFDCQEFVRKLSEKTGHTYRIPTEAEWEYACRAGSGGEYSFGDDVDQLKHHAWYIKNSGLKPQPGGVKEPNAWGLYDMHGNAWEWCQDWYGKDYYSSSPLDDPPGPATGHDRIIRGGGWLVTADECRSANRARFNPVNGINYNTCRVVMVPE